MLVVVFVATVVVIVFVIMRVVMGRVIAGMIVGVIVSMVMVMVMSVMIMTVIMPMIVVMMVVTVIAHRRVIGAALRFERSINGGHLGAEAMQQRFDRGIGLQPEPALQNLHRHMTIAEMPGKSSESRQVDGTRLDQRLGFRDDLDEPTIVEHQRVVGAEPHRLREVELDASAFDPEQKTLLRLTLSMRQNERVGGNCIPPLGSTKNAGGARHEFDPISWRSAKT